MCRLPGDGGAKRVMTDWSKKPGALLAAALMVMLAACGRAPAVQPAPPLFTEAPIMPSEANPFIPTGAIPMPSETAPVEPPSTAVVELPTATIPQPSPTPREKPFFDRFVDAVKNDNPDQVVGVYVDNVLALRVLQQPPDNPGFVSTVDGTATQFLLAFTVAGNIGLLAHNYLSGELFFQLQPGDVVQLIYGDGSVDEYEVREIQQYQALSPNSPYSDFVDLSNGETMNSTALFNRVYTGSLHLTFQTCINRDNNSEWGRLFVIADPLF